VEFLLELVWIELLAILTLLVLLAWALSGKR
jgi:hypothetical protein